MKIVILSCFVCCVLVFPPDTRAQFFLTSAYGSPEQLALGGMLTSSFARSPLSTIDHPALLCLQHSGSSVEAGTIVVPAAYEQGLKGFARGEIVVLATTPLSAFWPALEGLTAGIGFSNRIMDIPNFLEDRYESDYLEGSPGSAHRIHCSIAYEHGWVVAAGGVLKLVREPSYREMREFTAYDFSVGSIIPILGVRSDTGRSQSYLVPGIDLSLGASWGDLGSGVMSSLYVGGPPERRVNLGMGIRFSLSTTSATGTWKALSVTLLREARDDLLRRSPKPDSLSDAITEELGWMGQIQPFRNLVAGETSGDVMVTSAVEVGLLDIFYLRFGRVQVSYYVDFGTVGIGFSSRGLFHILGSGREEDALPILRYLNRHFRLAFDSGWRGSSSLSSLSFGVEW